MYAIIDNDNQVLKIKTQLNHITSSNWCYKNSDNPHSDTYLAVVEIKVVEKFPNNKFGLEALRKFNEDKKKGIKSGKNIPNDIGIMKFL